MNFLINVLAESWHLLLESSVYILFGIAFSGLLKVFLSPNAVANHLGKGRFASVFKAAFFGIPIPLCSCGVLPAAISLRKQVANKGATTAFLISTPESGVDSISITYALMDPIMTIARPVAAFFTALSAGITENLFGFREEKQVVEPDLRCPIDNCCDGAECPADEHRNHHSFWEKLKAGFGYSFGELWHDIAGWFLVGILLAGLITVLIPDEIFSEYLGAGLPAMLLMLAVGIPLYICATASTPIAAALILKGVSPGAALVFLLAGPATNMASLTVLTGLLGKRATAIYLTAIAVCAVAFGLAVDGVYASLGLSAQATVGQASEIVPYWLQLAGALIVLAISVKPVWGIIKAKIDALGRRTKGAASMSAAGDGGFPSESGGGPT